MMPPTWGRTSAIRWGAVRPDSSVVKVTGSGVTVTTPTSGEGLAAAGGALAVDCCPQPVIMSRPAKMPSRVISLIVSTVFMNCFASKKVCLPSQCTRETERKCLECILSSLDTAADYIFARQGLP